MDAYKSPFHVERVGNSFDTSGDEHQLVEVGPAPSGHVQVHAHRIARTGALLLLDENETEAPTPQPQSLPATLKQQLSRLHLHMELPQGTRADSGATEASPLAGPPQQLEQLLSCPERVSFDMVPAVPADFLGAKSEAGLAVAQEAPPPLTPWLGGGDVKCASAGTGGGGGGGRGGGGGGGAGGLQRRSAKETPLPAAPASREDDHFTSMRSDQPYDRLSSPHNSNNNWVDTVTLWSAVQRTGEEMQRKQKLKGTVPTSSYVSTAFGLGQARRRLVQRIRTQIVVTARVAMKDPTTVIIPLVLLLVLLAFGLWGVFSVAYAIRDGRIQTAHNAAVDFGKTLSSHIVATVAPASTVKTLIQLDPDWPSINHTFFNVAPKLVEGGLQSSAILTIVLCPQGIVSAIVPDLPDWRQVYNLDLLKNVSWRGDALKTVILHGEQGERGMVMTGPSKLRAGMMGIVTRYAVFVEGAGPQETFGANGTAHNCTQCFLPGNQTAPSRRFWGFAQLNVDWDILVRNVTRMYDLCQRDRLHFNMTYIDPVTFINRSIAACGDGRDKPVSVDIDIMHNHWSLAVYDSRGWTPDWLPLVVAIVVVASVWIAVMMAIILINRREHMWLLQAMLPKKVIAALRRGEDYAEAFECVTVLFSDIVSYTTIASTMEPIKVVRLLNEMYSAFDALVDEYDCYKVETIGDAFMAVCGTQGEDAVTAAVKVARLAQAMIDRTRVLVSQDGQKIQIRIGLHSGPVVGAVVGFKMPHFCLCGDTVNTASRMESNSKPMRIHVSNTTAQLLQESGEAIPLESRGPVAIKGKGTMWTHWLLPHNSQEPHDHEREGADGSRGGGGGGGGGVGEGNHSHHNHDHSHFSQGHAQNPHGGNDGSGNGHDGVRGQRGADSPFVSDTGLAAAAVVAQGDCSFRVEPSPLLGGHFSAGGGGGGHVSSGGLPKSLRLAHSTNSSGQVVEPMAVVSAALEAAEVAAAAVVPGGGSRGRVSRNGDSPPQTSWSQLPPQCSPLPSAPNSRAWISPLHILGNGTPSGNDTAVTSGTTDVLHVLGSGTRVAGGGGLGGGSGGASGGAPMVGSIGSGGGGGGPYDSGSGLSGIITVDRRSRGLRALAHAAGMAGVLGVGEKGDKGVGGVSGGGRKAQRSTVDLRLFQQGSRNRVGG